MCGGAPCTQLSWTEWSLRLFVSSVLLLSLTIFSLLNSAAKLPLSLSSIVIFTLTALLNLLTACLPPLLRPRCTHLCTQARPFTVQIPYARVNLHLHTFIPFTGKVLNNLPLSVFPPAYDLNSLKRRVSGHLSSWIWSLLLDTPFFSLIGAASNWLFFFFFFVPLSWFVLCKTTTTNWYLQASFTYFFIPNSPTIFITNNFINWIKKCDYD